MTMPRGLEDQLVIPRTVEETQIRSLSRQEGNGQPGRSQLQHQGKKQNDAETITSTVEETQISSLSRQEGNGQQCRSQLQHHGKNQNDAKANTIIDVNANNDVEAQSKKGLGRSQLKEGNRTTSRRPSSGSGSGSLFES